MKSRKSLSIVVALAFAGVAVTSGPMGAARAHAQEMEPVGIVSPLPLVAEVAGKASSTTDSVRLTMRDIGPETGFSGSGTGFTFDRDTSRIILPSPQRIFRSVNGGRLWSPLDFTGVDDSGIPSYTEGSNFVRQDPRNLQVLYAVGAHGGNLARSDDFGATWMQLGDESFFNFNFADVAVHEASPDVVLALKKSPGEFEGPALWRSEDGGATFTPQWNSGLPLEAFDWDTGEGCFPAYTNIATTPTDPNIVYVVQLQGDDAYCPPGIHKSLDGGLTFVRLDSTPPGTPIQVFPHPTRPGVLFVQTANPINSAIYRSEDGGASFQLVTGGLPNQNFFVSFDRNNPSSIYVAGRRGVFRSQDDGETFQPLGLTAQQLGQFATNVNIDPSDPNIIYVNTFNGNFKSVDGGLTFQAINNGWKAAFIRAIAFDNGANPTLYLATDHGIMRTNTRGRNYESVSGPRSLNDTRLLAISPSNPDIILASTSSGVLYQTVDGGRSWNQSIADTGPVVPDVIAFDPQNSNNVYFMDGGIDISWFQSTTPGFYKSIDAGATFELTVDARFFDIAVDPIHTNVIFGGIAGLGFFPFPLSRSVDSGLSFGAIPDRQAFVAADTFQILIDPQEPNNIFLRGGFFFDELFVEHDVIRSTDGGVTFSPADSGLPNCSELVMNPADPARLYCWSSPLGLSVTSDGGRTWSVVYADEIAKLPGFETITKTMLINPRSPTLLYLLGSSLIEVQVHEK